jgi:hypothetical protein
MRRPHQPSLSLASPWDFSIGMPALTTTSPIPTSKKISLSVMSLPTLSTLTGATTAVYPNWITKGSTGSAPILVTTPLPATMPHPFALSAPPPPSLQATISTSDLLHLTLQQFLYLQGPKPLVYQGPICKYVDPSAAPPIVVIYPDGPSIGPSPAAASGTLSLGPDTMNLNTPSGSTAFFL